MTPTDRFTIKATSPAGFPVSLQLEGANGAELMGRAAQALAWLQSNGFTPPTPPPAAQANGASNDDQAEPKVCPIHHTPMRRRTGGGDVWYSHKAVDPSSGSEYWCRGTEKVQK